MSVMDIARIAVAIIIICCRFVYNVEAPQGSNMGSLDDNQI